MKKIIRLLTIISIMILGINGVNAEDRGTYIGNCSTGSQINASCNYECIVADDSGHYLKFNYNAEIGINNKLSNSVSLIATDGDCDIFGNKSGCGYDLFELTLKHNPTDHQFLSSGAFICPPVVPTVNVRREIEKSLFGALWKTHNYVSIDVDSSYTPDNRPGYEQEELDTSCGLLGGKSSKIVLFLQKIYKYIKIIIPVLVVILSIMDFIKVIGTGKDDDMKKAINKFGKRIVIVVLIILVPLLISLVINISGVTSQYSKINDGLKAVFCILE